MNFFSSWNWPDQRDRTRAFHNEKEGCFDSITVAIMKKKCSPTMVTDTVATHQAYNIIGKHFTDKTFRSEVHETPNAPCISLQTDLKWQVVSLKIFSLY